MAAQLSQGLVELRVIGTKKLNNSGLVYELDKTETASWVRRQKAAFMAGFGGTAVVRDRATSVIVKFIPVVHSPDTLSENRRIKCDSRLDDGSLTSTRWIKPLQRLMLGQKAAHLIAHFKTNTAADEAIKEGMVIVGKRVWARWMQKELRICLKCQLLTAKHLAAECNQQAPCNTCGKAH